MTITNDLAVLAGGAGSGVTYRNRLINGGFQVWQRGTSFAMANGASADIYTADRWLGEASGGGGNQTGSTVTFAQASDSSGLYGGASPYYMNISCPSFANTSSVPNSQMSLFQRIESLNVYDLAGKNVTFSFYTSISSSSGGTFTGQVYIGYPNSVDNWSSATYVGPITFPISSTPQKFSFNTTLTSSYQNGCVVYIRVINTGSTATGVNFNIGSAQFEQGLTASQFEHRSYGQELLLCQRYAYVLSGTFLATGAWSSSTNCFYSGQFPITMRTTPTLSLSAAASSYSTYLVGPATYLSLTGLSLNGVTGAEWWLLTASFASGGQGQGQTTYLNSNGNYILFQAEL